MSHLYIIRGLPGSGKSTFARRLVDAGIVAKYGWYEADMFFANKWGKYNFQADKLPEAHGWCKQMVFLTLKEDDAIVSNTFSRIREMQPYIDYCNENGHTFTVITCEGNYGNVHGVPDKAIERMRQRWEKYE